MNMKKLTLIFSLVAISSVLLSFDFGNNFGESVVYKCTTCCKVKNGDSNNAPWESGCKSSSGMHSYVFVAHSGSMGYYCSKCKTEIYVRQGEGASASASRCCSDNGLCSWYNK